MKLGRNKQTTTRQRRQPVDPGSRPVASSYSYRTSRSQQPDNVGRDTSREPLPNQPRDLGRFILRRFGLIILIIALIVSLINVASLSNQPKVIRLADNGSNNLMHNDSDYQAEASKLLSSSIWNKNKITVNSEEIDHDMLKKFPELSSVSLTLPVLSKRPILYIQTSTPTFVLSTNQGSFVIDNNGKALLLKDNLADSSSLNLPVINDLSGVKVVIGSQVVASSNVAFIRTVVAQLDAKNYKVNALTLPAATSELDVNLDGQPYIVKFNLRTNDARQQVGTFLATISKLKSQNITPSQYVDVRVDGRSYYK